MRFIVNNAKLLESLNHVKGVVQSKTTEPILTCILLKAHDNTIEIAGTDLEIAASDKFNAEVTTSGSCVVSCHMLRDLIKNVPDSSNVEVFIDDDQAKRLCVIVHSKNGSQADYKFPILPVAQFPDISQQTMPNSFSVDAHALHSLFDSVSFAMASGDPRYYLNGLYMHSNDKELLVVATDGHRLARCSIDLPDTAGEISGMIISNKAVSELIRLLPEINDKVEVSFSDTRISFKLGEMIFTARLIDGKYPDYERVIPHGNDKIMQIQLSDLTSAVCRVATMSSQEDNAIKMKCSDNKMTLQANNDNGSSGYEGLEEVNINYDNSDVEIGFNSKYLLEVGKKISGDTIEIVLGNSDTPVLIKQPRRDDALYVLMPMRV